MTNASKEGVVECLWGEADSDGEFDIPERGELFNDDGIASLFADLDPQPSGRIARERTGENDRLIEQLRNDRQRMFGVRPLMITAAGQQTSPR